jgi:signal transduction histidine kinase
MKLSTKIILLTTSVALCVAFLIIISIRGVVINAFRTELEKKAVSLAGTLSERIANTIILKDHFQTTKALNEVLNREKDLEYIFVTDEEGNIFTHTFHNGTPPDILSWNPLNNRAINIQLLDTEVGYIRDVGVTIIDGTKSELHVGIKEASLKSVLSRMRNITMPIIIVVILLGMIASFFISRLITEPLNRFVEFTRILGSGEFNRRLEVQSRDEVGYLAHSFNRLSWELKAAKEKMQAEKLSSIGQISAGLAHELKNPITTLKMLFQAFREQPDMTKEDAEIIHNEIEKIDTILTRFLGFVRQKDFHSSEIDINTLVDHVLTLATFDLQHNGIVVYKNMIETLPHIKGDRSLLEQVFLNLVLNSIQAMPDGGEIRISGKTDNGFVEIMIWDKGSGIPSDITAKVFDPFFTTKADGTGLGLSIAYNIIKTHGGQLYFNSNERSGTVFTVKLPKEAEHG